MNRITLYILKSLVTNFLFTFCAASVIFISIFAFQTLRAVSADLEGIVKILPSVIGSVSFLLVVVSATFACTGTYASLSAQNEYIAMLATGIPFHRIAAPALYMGLVLGGISVILNEEIVPAATRTREMAAMESAKSFLENPPHFPFEDDIGGDYRISYAKVTGSTMNYVTIYKPYAYELFAERARYDAERDTLVLENCNLYSVGKGGDKTGTASFDRYEVKFFEQQQKELTRVRYLDREEIVKALAEGKLGKFQISDARTELLARPLRGTHCLVICVLCAFVGLTITKASRLAGLAAALPILGVYILVTHLFENSGKTGGMSVALACGIPIAILIAIAVPFAIKVKK